MSSEIPIETLGTVEEQRRRDLLLAVTPEEYQLIGALRMLSAVVAADPRTAASVTAAFRIDDPEGSS